MIKQYLLSKREIILENLLSFICSQKQEAEALECNAIDFLKKFVIDGKLYRGSLVFLGYDLFSQKESTLLSQTDEQHLLMVNLAQVLELTHSALLLHDDVMDRDDYRRGNKTFNCLMSETGRNKGVKNSQHFGNSLATCLGDLLLFWSGKLLTSSLLNYSDKSVVNQINDIYHHKMELTVWGQMDDVCLAAVEGQVNKDLIYHLYSQKSGHYSIVNPLIIGAIIAGADDNSLNLLTKLALDLGIIFQIKDDYINLFGDLIETGKSIGSDIKENKKTLFRSLLLEKANDQDREKLSHLFGNQQLTKLQFQEVKRMMNEYGVVQEVQQSMSDLEEKVMQSLAKLNLSAKQNQLLDEFIQLIVARNS